MGLGGPGGGEWAPARVGGEGGWAVYVGGLGLGGDRKPGGRRDGRHSASDPPPSLLSVNFIIPSEGGLSLD